jgi:TfoX/Sxy family transcriptional regulator of competence genes
MAYSESLADRVRLVLGRRRNLAEKKLFGGLGFLLKGNMLVGIWKSSLIVRLDKAAYEQALQQTHVREFDITGRPMKGWVLVDAEGIESDENLRDWIELATSFVATLPEK